MTREHTIQALVRCEQPIEQLRAALARLPWDWDGPPLARLTTKAVALVIRRYASGELTAEEVEAWANLVEARDDIDAEPVAAEAIFDLANPELQGRLSDIASTVLARL